MVSEIIQKESAFFTMESSTREFVLRRRREQDRERRARESTEEREARLALQRVRYRQRVRERRVTSQTVRI